MNIGVAYGLSELILSLRLAKRDPPKLERLECMPKVALLYATYNDVMPEILDALHNQSYSNCDIFVLDDSTDKRCGLIVDACGFPVIRRSSRSGFKAGALNNWLSLYGRVYDCFIILDADSLIGQDFIEEMLRYAEHPFCQNSLFYHPLCQLHK